MEVVFKWNVINDSVIKTFELMGEFNQGEQDGIVKKCFEIQRRLERSFVGTGDVTCYISLEDNKVSVNRIEALGSVFYAIENCFRSPNKGIFEAFENDLRGVC